MLDYASVRALAREAQARGMSLGQVVLEDQSREMGKTQEEMLEMMDRQLSVMEQSAVQGGRRDIRSQSGLTGGDGWRMGQYARQGQPLGGGVCAQAMATALSVAECNAAMGKIVASPTAGSCGILPGAVLTMMDKRGVSRHQACVALMAAGGVGMVIARQASISGAEGGCQAECGSAAAMAAAALVYLEGGDPQQCADAAAFALMNLLGLVCDPVGGLVEVPCVYRNVGASGIAFTAADMALSGIRCPIEPDEVILAMKEVGDALPTSLRETGEGGCAACESICKRLHHKE